MNEPVKIEFDPATNTGTMRYEGMNYLVTLPILSCIYVETVAGLIASFTIRFYAHPIVPASIEPFPYEGAE